MGTRRVVWALLGLTSALAVTVAASASGAGASTQAAADRSWTDAVGDARGGAPDLTAVRVSHDEAGTITMTVTVSMVDDTDMCVFFDTDLNDEWSDSTGKKIVAVGTGPGVVVPLAYANDADGDAVQASFPSLRMSSTATTVTLSFAKTDLRIGRGFGFWIGTETLAQRFSDSWGDDMPDEEGTFTYVFSPAPSVVKPVIGAAVTTPKVAVAGKRFTVSFPVTRSDTGAPLTRGKMICNPSVAGQVIRHAESFTGGRARLSFVVPANSAGRLLKVKVTIKAAGQSTTKVATFRIR
jgi:hypothetical protein